MSLSPPSPPSSGGPPPRASGRPGSPRSPAGWTERRGLDFGDPTDYDALWRWSVEHLDQFWADVAGWTRRAARRPGRRGADLPRDAGRGLVPRPRRSTTPSRPSATPATTGPRWSSSPRTASRSRSRGRRCAARSARSPRPCAGSACSPATGWPATCPTCPRRVIAFLGAASIGAVWSSCAPDFGTRAVLDRFAQIEPTVLVAVDGYRFDGKDYDRRDVVAELRAALPTVRTTVAVPRLFPDEVPDGALAWADAVADEQEPAFEALPFDHPLWIVYSSGTTGLPKGIVHGHGGVVLEQRKQLGLHLDVGAGDRFFWYASTAWIMWNIAAGALLAGATVVVYDGAPTYPGRRRAVRPRRPHRDTYLGTSAGYLSACEKAGAPARRAARPVGAARRRGHRLAAAAPAAYPLGLRRGEVRRVPRLAVGRHRRRDRLHRRLPAAAGDRGRAAAADARRRRGVLERGRAAGRRASSASWWSPSRCRRCRCASGTTRTASATARPTSSRGPASGGTATGWRSPSAAPA